MSNLFERSILMTLGAAMLTKEMAESLTGSLTEKGEETTALGREAIDEAVEKAKTEARSLRGRFDGTLQRNFREMGLAPSSEVEELQLKVAQLEHRISLLEAAQPADAKPAPAGAAAAETTADAGSSTPGTSASQAPPANEAGKEGVIGEAVSRAPETSSGESAAASIKKG